MNRPIKWCEKQKYFVGMYKYKNGNEVPLFKVETLHELSQLVGYVKYTNDKWNIYYRGQNENYPLMRPSIYRIKKDKKGREYEAHLVKKAESINKYIEKHKNTFTKLGIPDYAVEPTLQHYGFTTRWIDVVDNIWVALWFGLYKEVVKINNKEYKYILKNENECQYFYLIGSDAKNEVKDKNGYYDGSETLLIDLRKACPSQFIRPHSQHGLLIRKKIIQNENDKELDLFVACIIKIKTSKANEWIGNSIFMSPGFIYPSPFYDECYTSLIDYITTTKDEMRNIGSISYISY